MLDKLVLIVFIKESIRHNRIPLQLILFDLNVLIHRSLLLLQQCAWQYRLSGMRRLLNGTLRLRLHLNDNVVSGSTDDSTLKHLLKLRVVVATVRIHVVGFHVRPIYCASECRIRVSIAVRVEGWLTEISRYGRVRQPSADSLHTLNFIIDVFPLLSGLCSLLSRRRFNSCCLQSS